MGETLAYGTDKQMILFDVKITDFVIEGLVNLGFLEENEFDKEAYYDEYDVYESRELAKPILDAMIEYYEFKVDDEEEKLAENEFKDEWVDLWDNASHLEKILLMGDLDTWCDCVKIKEVDPLDPYGLNRKNKFIFY